MTYINTTYNYDSALGKLIHDFKCTNPDDMNYQILAETARYYKEDKEEISAMCKAVEDLITDEKKNIAMRMLEVGKMSVEEIAKCSDLSVQEVEKLAATVHSS